MLIIIITLAVIIFLFTIFYFFKDSIVNFFRDKVLNLFKKPFKKKEKKKDAPKPEEKKEKPKTYSVEDFKPISKESQDLVRDSSLNDLFGNDDFIDTKSDDFGEKSLDGLNDDRKNSFNDELFRKYLDNSEFDFGPKEKTLAEKINELPPEIKVLIIDNLLDRKEDDDILK